MKGEPEEEEGGEDGGDAASSEESDGNVVEFTAGDHETWERLLREKMERAGVTEILPDGLSITDAKGALVDLTGGTRLRPEHFPIRVRYSLPVGGRPRPPSPVRVKSTYVPLKRTLPPQRGEAKREDPEQECQEEDNEPIVVEKSAIHISGVNGLTKKHVLLLIKAKGLPMPDGSQDPDSKTASSKLKHLKTEVIKEGDRVKAKDSDADGEWDEKDRNKWNWATVQEVLHKDGPYLLSWDNASHTSRVGAEAIQKESMLVEYATEYGADLALRGFETGFKNLKIVDDGSSEQNPALYRARNGLMKFRFATSADQKNRIEPKKEPKAVEQRSGPDEKRKERPRWEREQCLRLRINGDAEEV
ncbi:unnamed protein product, partial [Prorocentrum cordatum]